MPKPTNEPSAGLPELDNLLEAVFNAGRISAGEAVYTMEHEGKWLAIKPSKAKAHFVSLIQSYTLEKLSTLLDTIQTDVLEGGLPKKRHSAQLFEEDVVMPDTPMYSWLLSEGFNESINQTAAIQSEKLRVIREGLK